MTASRPRHGIESRVGRHIDDQLDTQTDRAVANVAARQIGVVTTDDLRGCGVSKDGAHDRARAGTLHRRHRGVYVVGHANATVDACWLAGVKACGPRAVLSAFAAAALHGYVTWDFREPDVTVASQGTRVRPGLRVHRTNRLDPRDITTVRGIPVTTPARTIVDLAGQATERELKQAVRRAQALHDLEIRDILAALDRAGRRRGATTLRRLLAADPAPTRTVLEDVVLDLILAGGLAPPDVNTPMYLEGQKVVPDFRWPAHRAIVEADGGPWHDRPLARRADAERQALLEQHGERVIRVTWEQAITKPAQTLARIQAALDSTALMISTNQFKNGNHIDVEGTVFKILEFQHVKPGKGGAFVRTKLRRASDGNVIDRTFRAGEKFRAVRTEARKMQFLYADGTDAHFMDTSSYEQLAIPEPAVKDALRWTKASDEVDVLFIDDEPSDLQIPASVELEVTETEPGLRGDTASGGGNKPATLETGATIQVPLFVNVGDRVKVQTSTGDYMSRA
jgi:elongation factor P